VEAFTLAKQAWRLVGRGEQGKKAFGGRKGRKRWTILDPVKRGDQQQGETAEGEKLKMKTVCGVQGKGKFTRRNPNRASGPGCKPFGKR